jgi:uncharacterized GH25 family protein
MKHRLVLATGLAFAAAVLPHTLQAHRQWMLPSSTVVSGNGTWVTVDAAVSNDLFFFDHQPLRLTSLVVTAPDGSTVKAENASTGRYRSTFDVKLEQKGTYKIASIADQVTASYDENGQVKRWQGTWAAFAKEVPANAANLAVQRTSNRLEIFVTSGAPSDQVLKPTGIGLELAPVTHPNDIVTEEPATLALLLDGKPAANLAVDVIPGGIRYRDSLNDKQYRTDKDGRFVVTFAEPGMYWINASYQEGGGSRRQGGARAGGAGQSGAPQAGGNQTGRQGGGRGQRQSDGPVQPGRRASYTATLEVLPQ